MDAVPYIRAGDVEGALTWRAVADAIEAGHRRELADLGDLLLHHGENSLLNRGAWIEGLGVALKSVTVFPSNPGRQPPLPSIQGVMLLFDAHTGALQALLDGALVTWWKTAGDSVLGARLLARPDAASLLVVGAGVVARSLVDAYREVFPGLRRVAVWNRSPGGARALAAHAATRGVEVEVVEELARAAGEADIISCATLSREPVLRGEWIAPGTHVDLIGAFRPDMREADDALLQRAELFVDSRRTTLEDIGELRIPLASGAIERSHVRGDLYELCNGAPGRSGPGAITVYKNGGGAHLDLMTAKLIHAVWSDQR